MKIKNIRDLADKELNQKLAELKIELFNLRFQHATNQLDNPMRMKEVKKTIAKIKSNKISLPPCILGRNRL